MKISAYAVMLIGVTFVPCRADRVIASPIVDNSQKIEGVSVIADDIISRLTLIEDKMALQSLMNHYRQYGDSGRVDDWANCWTEDAILEMPANDSVDLPHGSAVVGREQIRASAERRRLIYDERQHILSNLEFDVHGDSATGVGTLWFVAVPKRELPETNLKFGGHYEWEFKRTAEGWKISRMKLRIIWNNPVAE